MLVSHFLVYHDSVLYKENLIKPYSAIYFDEPFHQLFIPTQVKRSMIIKNKNDT